MAEFRELGIRVGENTQETMDRAVSAYKHGLADGALGRERSLFEGAARLFESALPRLGGHLHEQRATIHKNLAKTHRQLAFIAAEEGAEERVCYHVRQMADQTSRHAGRSAAAWVAFTSGFVDGAQERARNLDLQLVLLDAFARTGPPTQPSVDMAIARCCIHKALRMTPDGDYRDAIDALRRRAPTSARRQWLGTRQLVQRAGPKIVSALSGACGDEGTSDLIDQARFLHHRGSVVLALSSALEMQDRVMQTEDFDMQCCLEVLDALIHALHVAQDDPDLPSVLGQSKLDIEMTCVCLHYLAKLYEILQLQRQARARHRECVCTALSLDAAGANTADELFSGSRAVRGLLADKWWFQASVAFMQNAQREQVEAEAAEREAKLRPIQPMLARLREANTGVMPLLKALYRHHPLRKGSGCPAEPKTGTNLSRAEFLRALRDYSSDKQHEGDSPVGWELETWKAFCTEVSKMLNFYYERDYKSS